MVFVLIRENFPQSGEVGVCLGFVSLFWWGFLFGVFSFGNKTSEP